MRTSTDLSQPGRLLIWWHAAKSCWVGKRPESQEPFQVLAPELHLMGPSILYAPYQDSVDTTIPRAVVLAHGRMWQDSYVFAEPSKRRSREYVLDWLEELTGPRSPSNPSPTVCPRASSAMTPCVVRDGSIAVADDGACVGCGFRPEEFLAEKI